MFLFRRNRKVDGYRNVHIYGEREGPRREPAATVFDSSPQRNGWLPFPGPLVVRLRKLGVPHNTLGVDLKRRDPAQLLPRLVACFILDKFIAPTTGAPTAAWCHIRLLV